MGSKAEGGPESPEPPLGSWVWESVHSVSKKAFRQLSGELLVIRANYEAVISERLKTGSNPGEAEPV